MDNLNPGRTDSRFVSDSVDVWLILPVAVLSLIAMVLFIPLELGVNVPVFIFTVYIVVFSYQGRAGSEADRGSIYLLLIVLVASLPFLLYDTSPFRILQFVLLGFFVLFQVFTMYGCRYYKRLFSENWLFDACNAVIFMPFSNFDALTRVLRTAPKPRRRLLTAVFTVFGILTAPGLAVFLSGAWKKGTASAVLAGAAGIVFFAFFSTYLYGFLYGCRHARRTHTFKKPDSQRLKRIPSALIVVLLTLLCVGCTVYIVAQVLYFMPAFSGQLQDADLAEYARLGFLELCGVVLLNLAVIAFAAVFTRPSLKKTFNSDSPEPHRTSSASPVVLALIVILCVLSILLIVAAFLKMLLYMRAYGLTTNRLITSWFMLGLALVCIIIIARAFSPRVRLIRSISMAAVVMFLLLCFADCDYLALSYNRTAYVTGQLPGFDIEMLYDCGDSIVPVMIEVYENSSGQVQQDARRFLEHYRLSYDDSLGAVRSFNIASYNAHNKYTQWISEA